MSRSRSSATEEREGADVERDVTVLVKTFERPEALLRLIRSIRRFYPRISVLVVDDSREALSPVPAGITSYVHEPYDSLGLSGGRNLGLRRVETDYVLVCDDDMVFGRRTRVARMLRTVERTPFDVVSCLWLDHDPWTRVTRGVNRFEGTVELRDGVLVHEYGATRGTLAGLPVFDVVHNFFVASRERLGEEPWDERLKIGYEHTEFFLRLRERGLLATRIADAVVYHYPELPPAYQAVREDRARYLELWREQRGFERREFAGRLYARRDGLRYRWPSSLAHQARRGSRGARRLLREARLRAGVTLALAALALCLPAARAHAATIVIGRGLGPWELGQGYDRRPGLLRSELHPGRNGPGCDLGPRSASRIDYYPTSRLAWRGLRAGRISLIDVATTRKGDRTADGFVVGRSRLRGVRRAHPNGVLSHPGDRYRLSGTAVTVVRQSAPESWVSLVYWFDRQSLLVGLETSRNGC